MRSIGAFYQVRTSNQQVFTFLHKLSFHKFLENFMLLLDTLVHDQLLCFSRINEVSFGCAPLNVVHLQVEVEYKRLQTMFGMCACNHDTTIYN